jgi:hypothetical protein
VLATFNGVDRVGGGYLFEPQDLATIAASLEGREPSGPLQSGLDIRHEADEAHLGLLFGFDPEVLSSVGWGVVVGPGVGDEVLAQLEQLLSLREAQAGERFRRLTYHSGEDSLAWLDRHCSAPGDVDPRKLPYYLLLVGGPDSIPFEFQYSLGVDHAVGRVHFDDVHDYGQYAENVCNAERRSTAARAHLFGPRNPDDKATALSSELLVDPVAQDLLELSPGAAVGRDVGGAAKRSRLEHLLTADDGPSVLITASHGLGDKGLANRETQGALVCQEWAGPLLSMGGVGEDAYFAGRHVATDRAITVQVLFAFACYSAGTPAISDFADHQLSPVPFVGLLPQKLLANPAGGALAFVGHVDRAYGYSFMWTGADPQVTAMSGTILALLAGKRLGGAMESLTSKHASVGATLSGRLGDLRKYGKTIDPQALVWLWTAYYDARNYVIIGDPAVRAVRRV